MIKERERERDGGRERRERERTKERRRERRRRKRERERERERERKCVGSASVYFLLRLREYACERGGEGEGERGESVQGRKNSFISFVFNIFFFPSDTPSQRCQRRISGVCE